VKGGQETSARQFHPVRGKLPAAVGHESAANQNKDFRCGQQWTARFASLDHPTSSHPLSSAALEEFAAAPFEDDNDPVLLA
jgi:hypothetical protein